MGYRTHAQHHRTALTLNRVSPMILTPTEFALINFDGLVRTTYLDGAPLQKNQHGFPTEHPKSATVCVPWEYSSVIVEGLSRRTMSYVSSKISWRVRLPCWNQDPSLMDADARHLFPATLFSHRQRKLSDTVVSADHVISRPQELHFIALRSRPIS